MNPSEVFTRALQQFSIGQQPGIRRLPEIRDRRVEAIVQHVAKNVPLYRDLYREKNIAANEIKTADDLWRLPAVSKADYLRLGVRAYTHGAPDLLNLYKQRTSGSVGQALSIFATASESLVLHAALWSGWIAAGVTARDRILMMSAPYLAEKVDTYPMLFVPVTWTMDETVAHFIEFQPTVIIGMVESISLLAVELRRRNIEERRQVRMLFPFGQTYSALMRNMIASGFNARVFELYGSAEGGWLGFACTANNGLHVPESRVVVQIARTGKPDEPAAPGELGEVIITSLLRTTTPFVRYRLHDAAAIDPAPCSCGRTSPRIVQMEGRIQDFLVAKDGHWVGPGMMVIDLTTALPSIIDHRIVQETRDKVRASLVVTKNFSETERDEAVEILRKHLGPVEIELELVDSIPREASGKRRRVFRMFDLPE